MPESLAVPASRATSIARIEAATVTSTVTSVPRRKSCRVSSESTSDMNLACRVEGLALCAHVLDVRRVGRADALLGEAVLLHQRVELAVREHLRLGLVELGRDVACVLLEPDADRIRLRLPVHDRRCRLGGVQLAGVR